MSAIVYLGLGSNMGDRDGNLRRAIKLVDGIPCTSVLAVSSFVSSDASGFDGAPFRNCCIKVRSAVEPLRMLEFLKAIERELGRMNEGIEVDGNGNRVYHDRPIDIDILLYGRRHISSQSLTVPHPRMYDRDFVMIPLKEVRQG